MILSSSTTNYKTIRAFSLVEVLISSLVACIIIAGVVLLSIYSSRAFVALGNYSDLDAKSRNALDSVSRELRQCTALLAFETNATSKSLTLTNADLARSVQLSWDSDSRQLVFSVSGDQPRALLTGCDYWNFSLYTRAPNVTATDITFYPATNSAGALDPSQCKLIDMTWKCSRTILGNKVNTESVQTAQIVLRNKVR